jgi:membrane complex biogenesis BtpA family protein
MVDLSSLFCFVLFLKPNHIKMKFLATFQSLRIYIIFSGGNSNMWTKELFKVEKPIIALLHLRALPGDPDFCGNIEKVIDQAKADLQALQDGGVDGVLIANEFSLPYQLKAEPVTVGAMGYIVGRLKDEIHVPFGVNIVFNAMETLELAASTGASFIRSAFTGAYMGESGVMLTNAGKIARRKKELGLDNLKLLYKVNPESDAYLVPRDIQTITKSIKFNCNPDGLCVSGASAGCETDTQILADVKAVAGDTPVFCNTGFSAKTAREKLAICDAACVGTTFKVDGKFENNVDPARVIEVMNIVQQIRSEL